MKMRKLILIFTLATTIVFTGCLKDDPNVDFSHVGTIVELPYSGQGNFGSDALNFTSDTLVLSFTVNVASPYPPDHDIAVTVGTDLSQVATYNSTYGAEYEQFPADAYSFSDQTVTIKAGTRLATFTVTFYKTTLDPAVSYMLPITIKDASGETISGNYGTHYYHFIGNPIAGVYDEFWSRWNETATDTLDAPLYYKYDVGPVIFNPINATSISVGSQGTGETDIISFTNTAGVLTDFNVAFDPDEFDPSKAAYLGITLSGGPILEVADPVSGYYRIYFTYVNSSGLPRIIVNEYLKK